MIRWQSKGQSCINPSIRTSLLIVMVQTRRFPRGSAVNYGIVMNFSAEKSSRKWRFGAFGRTAAALVTVGIAALLVVPADPAMARRASHDIWGDLFGVRPKKPRKA